jgi:hypothetical protein
MGKHGGREDKGENGATQQYNAAENHLKGTFRTSIDLVISSTRILNIFFVSRCCHIQVLSD